MSNPSINGLSVTARTTLGLLAAALMIVPLFFTGVGGNYFTSSAMNNAYAQADVQVTKPSQELTKSWWKWIASIPKPQNPVTDTTGEDCHRGDFGAIFFLAGSDTGSKVTRKCTISEGQAILLPIINGLCYKSEPQETQASLNALCSSLFDHPKKLQLVIDGQSISNLRDYRVKVSSFFTVGTVSNNIFDLKPGFYQAVSDGYWVLVRGGLPAGQHTISVVGTIPVGDNQFFTSAVDYKLTVT
jgi:hypothetical protein